MLKVSVIVPFFNCPFISHALDSLLNQTYNDIEIIVINDGSTQYKEKIIPYLDKIIYTEKENGGTASALNVGIKLATGDYICWLSSDDIYYPQKIALQLEFMIINNALFSHTNYYAINAKGNIITPPIGFHPSSKLEVLKQMSKGNIINGCSTMINKNVLILFFIKKNLNKNTKNLKYTSLLHIPPKYTKKIIQPLTKIIKWLTP